MLISLVGTEWLEAQLDDLFKDKSSSPLVKHRKNYGKSPLSMGKSTMNCKNLEVFWEKPPILGHRNIFVDQIEPFPLSIKRTSSINPG